mgnify:CR=1 FL=1
MELKKRPAREPLTGAKLAEWGTAPADIKAVTNGERIALRAVGTPGCKVSIVGGCELTEVKAGVYQGLITAKKDCKVLAEPLQFKIEADYCIVLRDTTWRMGYAIVADVKAGLRPIPTAEELIAELPIGSAKWPDA